MAFTITLPKQREVINVGVQLCLTYVVPDSVTLLYTVPDTISRMTICRVFVENYDAVAKWFNMWAVPNGESVALHHKVLSEESIGGKTAEYFTGLEGLALNPGDKLYVQAETADCLNLSVTVSMFRNLK